MIVARANVNQVMPDGASPLICGARFGHEEVCRLLMKAGADCSARVVGSEVIGFDGMPVDVARFGGHLTIVTLLE